MPGRNDTAWAEKAMRLAGRIRSTASDVLDEVVAAVHLGGPDAMPPPELLAVPHQMVGWAGRLEHAARRPRS